jgi:hypothetical protein
MERGSNSQTDEVYESFRDGNWATGIGQMISGAPEIIGNAIDGAARYLWGEVVAYTNDVYQSHTPGGPHVSGTTGHGPSPNPPPSGN